jgi:LAGLIDADG DNA endonuclease family
MFAVGLDVDTRAYFTAATCAISLYIILSVKTSPKFFPIKTNLFKKYLHSKYNNNTQIKCELVSFNNPLFSNKIQKGILNKKSRDMITFNLLQRSIIVGILLSDGWMQIRKGWNPRIGFKQSFKHFTYCWYVFTTLSNLCSGYPWNTKIIKRGKLFFGIEFNTRQLKCLNEIRTLFYSEFKIKTIKPELYDYLDYIAIAHWIMGDGAKRNKGITLCTNNFSFKEVVILMNILKIKFDIDSTILIEKGKPLIYINKIALIKMLPRIKPYILNKFLYKVSL